MVGGDGDGGRYGEKRIAFRTAITSRLLHSHHLLLLRYLQPGEKRAKAKRGRQRGRDRKGKEMQTWTNLGDAHD
jgi:hypothetical protein